MVSYDIVSHLMKKCFKCNCDKPLEQFYRHPMMADGHLNKCKDCTKSDTKTRADHLKKTDPVWYESELDRHRVKSAKLRSEGRSIRVSAEARLRYALRHPLKQQARLIFQGSLRSGRVKRKPCEVCGECKAQAHHDDYCKPLDVRWLCVTHHNEHHKNERKALRAQGIYKITNYNIAV